MSNYDEKINREDRQHIEDSKSEVRAILERVNKLQEKIYNLRLTNRATRVDMSANVSFEKISKLLEETISTYEAYTSPTGRNRK